MPDRQAILPGLIAVLVLAAPAIAQSAGEVPKEDGVRVTPATNTSPVTSSETAREALTDARRAALDPGLSHTDPSDAAAPTPTPSDESEQSVLSALLRELTAVPVDDAPLPLDLGRGGWDERESRPDPLGRRRGGAFDLIESDAGGFSFDFGLVRAGRASAREKDRPLESMESHHLSVSGAAGPVQVLDAGVGWRFSPERDVTFSLESGLRTLSNAGPETQGDGGFADLSRDTITLPVIGAALRWDVLSSLGVEGGATGHMDDRQGTFVDLFAEARFDITSSTDVVAGYRFLDASFDSPGSNAHLSQDAIYAGIRIRY